NHHRASHPTRPQQSTICPLHRRTPPSIEGHLMNKIYKPLSVTAIAGLIATSLVACSPAGGSTSDVEDITLQVGDQIAGTEKILSAAGELDDLPYDITWSTFTSGPPQIEAL